MKRYKEKGYWIDKTLGEEFDEFVSKHSDRVALAYEGKYGESFDHLTKCVEKSKVIFFIPEDFLSFIPTGQDMVKSIRIVQAKGV